MNKDLSLSAIGQIAGIAILTSVIFVGSARGASGQRAKSITNARKIAIAAILYGDDHNQRMPLTIDGDLIHLKNYEHKYPGPYQSQPRTDTWVMALLPYHGNLRNYIDPVRGDHNKIFASPARQQGTTGTLQDNTFTNQNRFPMYALNYLYLSPIHWSSDIVDATGERFGSYASWHSFNQATDPEATIFFVESRRWSDRERGFYVINAPGATVLAAPNSKQLVFSFGTPCSVDWCGKGKGLDQTNTFHTNPRGGDVTFLDGHAKFMSVGQITAGTSFATAESTGNGGGSTIRITDKRKYLWNLDDDYLGSED